MGVKDLWNVAAPCEERISLHDLRGKTLAIDLAGWIVQNQTVAGLSHKVTRPHLRNLIFRTNTLLSLDILPVMVLDGQAPKVKSATVVSRNQANWGPRSSQSDAQSSPKVQKRRQFGTVLKECGRLLESLGVPVLIAPGEAEALCAALDRQGLVDGVISDDSDCLCYGARTVYRNFSTDPKNFSVSKYCCRRLRKELGLSRERIVVMALLLGSDYTPGGVCGVGKDNLVKMYQFWGTPVKGELEKVINWTELDALCAKKQPHCGTCGHPGTVGNHRKTGCPVCPDACVPGISCPCDYHSPGNQQLMVESSIRKKALESPGWPHEDVVDEFYRLDKERNDYSFKWKCPDPVSFIQICVTRMQWEQEYSIEKVQHLIARWQVQNSTKKSGIAPVRILRTRIQGGQNMLEIEFTSTLPSLPDIFSACVPTADVEKTYPDLLREFIELKESKKKKTTKKKKENKDPSTKQTGVKTSKENNTKLKGNQPSVTDFFKPRKLVGTGKPLSSVQSENVAKNSAVTSADVSVDLRPKNLLIKKINYGYMEKIQSARLVTPEQRKPEEKLSDAFEVEESLLKEIDSLQLTDASYSGGRGKGVSDTLHDSDIKQYLEETYNSELSGILDDIIGCTDSPATAAATVTNKFSSMKTDNLKHVFASKFTSQCDSVPQKTSTPEIRATSTKNAADFGSPCLKSSTSTNNTNDFGSPCLKSSTRTADVDEYDEFDLEVSRNTPFLERVLKRNGKK